MKFLKNLRQSMTPHVAYLEESMAEYVAYQDRVRR